MVKNKDSQGIYKLKILREKLNLSQSEMADKLGVSRSAVAQYESGAREFRLDLYQVKKFLLLLNASGMGIDDLL